MEPEARKIVVDAISDAYKQGAIDSLTAFREAAAESGDTDRDRPFLSLKDLDDLLRDALRVTKELP